jgi:hypothetical protein
MRISKKSFFNVRDCGNESYDEEEERKRGREEEKERKKE